MSKESYIVLTKRDLILFQYLFENKVSTLKRIHRDCFSSTSLSGAIRRVTGLVKHGYLKKQSSRYIGDHRFSYSITKKALSVYLDHSELSVDSEILNSNSEEHDIILIDIIKKLSLLGSVDNIYTENSLQCYSYLRSKKQYKPYVRLNSDGVFTANVNGEYYSVALEFEKSIKSSQRIKKKINDYYLEKGIDLVFLIYRSKPILDKYCKIEKLFCKDGEAKFFYIKEKDFNASKTEIEFTDALGFKLKLK